MKIWIATYRGRGYTFDAFADTAAKAREQLRRLLIRHAFERNIPPLWFNEKPNAFDGCLTLREVAIGGAYRNGEEIIMPPEARSGAYL